MTGCDCGQRWCGWPGGIGAAYEELVMMYGSAEAAGLASFAVTWAAPGDGEPGRHVLRGWLRTHGVDPRAVDYSAGVYVAAHQLLGEVIIYSASQRDARGRLVLAFGSPAEVARRVYVQPLGMPVPAVLRQRGEARARADGLGLPVAALLGGGRRGKR